MKRSSPGCCASTARSASASTSANRPIRAQLSAAAAADQPTAVSSASGEASTSSAISIARPGRPAFIANVADSASTVVRATGDDTRLRVVCRNAVARSGSDNIQN